MQRVIGGPQRRGHLLSEAERLRVAYHEAGHAVVTAALGRGDDVHRVSIVARGRGLAGVGLHREEDAVVLTRGQLRQRLVTALGGRAAEQLMFDEPSTGAEDDLEDATALARDMVGRYGMSDTLGLATLTSGATDFLGNGGAVVAISGTTHAALDGEVRHLLDEALQAATGLLGRHRDDLDRVTERLLADESLEGPTLRALLPAPDRESGDATSASSAGLGS